MVGLNDSFRKTLERNGRNWECGLEIRAGRQNKNPVQWEAREGSRLVEEAVKMRRKEKNKKADIEELYRRQPNSSHAGKEEKDTRSSLVMLQCPRRLRRLK